MTVEFLAGDLFDSPAQTLAHGVNCEGRMGAGIAVEFRRRFPAMYQECRRRCHHRILQPGDLFLWDRGEPWVLNLATQAGAGGATEEYVDRCIERLASDYQLMGIRSIAMPRIAAGLRGLSWPWVRSRLVEKLGPIELGVCVYELYSRQ